MRPGTFRSFAGHHICEWSRTAVCSTRPAWDEHAGVESKMPPRVREGSSAAGTERVVPTLSRRPSANTSSNGVENPIDPDAPREGRLASIMNKGSPAMTRGAAPKMAFKPKAVQRRRKDGAAESLLSIGAGHDDEGPSDSRLRRAERGRMSGRGRGRGARPEAPLTASGPFAQGPAMASVPNARGRGGSSAYTGGRMMSSTAPPGASGRSSSGAAKREISTKVSMEDEVNFDDAGKPMQNLLRMHRDTSDFWAPITTERIERTQKDTQIALPGEEAKLVKVKKEAEDIGFVDVKTEPTESTLTSRLPTPEAEEGDAVMTDVKAAARPGASEAAAANNADDDDDADDIALPGMVPAVTNTESATETKPKQEKKEKKEVFRVMTAEEAEEQDRLSTDLTSLRMNLTAGGPGGDGQAEQLIFIQLPEVLPFWQPGPDDERSEGFAKEEEVKQEIVEIDQQAEDRGDKQTTSMPRADKTGTSDGGVFGRNHSGDGQDVPAGVEGGGAAVATTTDAPKKRKKKQKPVPFPPPEGCVGQLHIHRSGRVTCDWGGITMDVGSGSDCGFLQEVVVVDTKTDKKAWSMGRISSRMMLTPNLDDLLGAGN